jgi:glycerol-3-phosphate dehydrogenase (NAD(P)+)
MAEVAIVGAGVMGTATAYPLTDNGHGVRLVGTHLDEAIVRNCREQRCHPRLRREIPRGVRAYFVEEIAGALDGVDIIVSGVSSPGVRWVGRTIGPLLRPGQLIIAVTKGLEAAENGDLVILPDALASELPPQMRHQVKLAAIGGPCIAGELAGRRQSCVLFGSRDGHAVERLAAVFRTSYYHVQTTNDLVGLEVCAALKNAYAIAVGVTLGLLERAGGPDAAGAQMHNLAAAVFAQGCAEMHQLLLHLDATGDFAWQLPGAGDLYVTCQGGRNVRLGRLLGQGHTPRQAQEMMAGESLEGVETVRVMGEALPKLEARGLISAQDLPLMRALVQSLVQGCPVDLPMGAFFRMGTLPASPT